MTTKTKSVPKLSTVPKGYWRNKFSSEPDAVFGDGSVNEAGEWYSPIRWPSRDVAETRATQHMKECADWVAEIGIRYLGPEFFPEDGEPK